MSRKTNLTNRRNLLSRRAKKISTQPQQSFLNNIKRRLKCWNRVILSNAIEKRMIFLFSKKTIVNLKFMI
jgi:hypothetical protein